MQRQEEPPEEEEPVQAKFRDGEMIQRMCPECKEETVQRQPMEEEEEELQAKEQPGQTPQVGSGVESRINSLKGGGRPLDPTTRSFFEPRFGRDFSHVRVHADSNASETAKSVNARAFTLGNNVVFGSWGYQPQSKEGKRLLGHELTHVVQQTEGTVQQKPLLQKKPRNRSTQKFLPPTKPELLETWIAKWRRWITWVERCAQQKLETIRDEREKEAARQCVEEHLRRIRRGRGGEPSQCHEALASCHIDCGAAARQVGKWLGGKRPGERVFWGGRSQVRCGRTECRNSKSRSERRYWDRIRIGAPDVCIVHFGNPTEEGYLVKQEVPIKPGMLIYTGEWCGGGEWKDKHMMMYYGEGKVLDSIDLLRPEPVEFEKVYDDGFFVVLRIWDPFSEARERLGYVRNILELVPGMVPIIESFFE